MHYSYFVVAIDGDFPWPKDAVELSFAGDLYELVPPTHQTHATIVLHSTLKDGSNGHGFARYDFDMTKVNRLLSALAWSSERCLSVISAIGGSNRKPWLRSQLVTTAPTLRGLWLFEASNDRQRRALALFREGLAIEHGFPASAFVAYFRAMEAALGAHTEPALRPKIEALSVPLSKETATMLSGQSLSKFLTVTNRHAFAHGVEDRTHSPDEANRVRPIRESIPLMKLVAQAAMTKELGIPTLCGMNESHRLDRLAPAPGWHELKIAPDR